MSQATVYFPQWREGSSGGKYPFTDGSTGKSKEGVLVPASLFTDARIFPVGGDVRQSITRIERSATQMDIAIADGHGETGVGIVQAGQDSNTIIIYDKYGRNCGMLLGQQIALSLFASLAIGTYTFPLGALEFVATCVAPQPQEGVRGILLESGELFTGDVWLVGEDGVVVRKDGDYIRLDIIGDPRFRQRACSQLSSSSSSTPQIPIQTINGISPNAYGGFYIFAGTGLAADNAVRVELQDYGLKLKIVGGGI